jgi:hypothetical protein
LLADDKVVNEPVTLISHLNVLPFPSIAYWLLQDHRNLNDISSRLKTKTAELPTKDTGKMHTKVEFFWHNISRRHNPNHKKGTHFKKEDMSVRSTLRKGFLMKYIESTVWNEHHKRQRKRIHITLRIRR